LRLSVVAAAMPAAPVTSVARSCSIHVRQALRHGLTVTQLNDWLESYAAPDLVTASAHPDAGNCAADLMIHCNEQCGSPDAETARLYHARMEAFCATLVNDSVIPKDVHLELEYHVRDI